jgi:DNA processing protein
LAEDQLARDLNQPTSALASALITLELDGHILRQPGSLLSRLT